MNSTIKNIVPFKGYGEFLLYQSVNEAKTVIKNHSMKYTSEVWKTTNALIRFRGRL